MSIGRRVARAFFQGETPDVARRLLGTVLVHDSPQGLTAGRIVETEAYLAHGDGASHSANGPTVRNASMFLAPGHVYLYRIYGVHLCFNVVTAKRDVGEAVLIRALEPLEGLELMGVRRGRSRVLDLCRGPGRLTQALGMELRQDGMELNQGALRLHQGASGALQVSHGCRVGITRSAALPLRFAIAERWVSRPACEMVELP